MPETIRIGNILIASTSTCLGCCYSKTRVNRFCSAINHSTVTSFHSFGSFLAIAQQDSQDFLFLGCVLFASKNRNKESDSSPLQWLTWPRTFKKPQNALCISLIDQRHETHKRRATTRSENSISANCSQFLIACYPRYGLMRHGFQMKNEIAKSLHREEAYFRFSSTLLSAETTRDEMESKSN